MELHLPDNASLEDVEKTYFRQLYAICHTMVGMARIAKLNRRTIREKFNRWGWKETLVESPAPAPAPIAPPAGPPPAPACAPPSPRHDAACLPDLVAPDVRARMEQIKARRTPPRKSPPET